VADPVALQKKYADDLAAGKVESIGDYSNFFYYPYDSSVSPYYKNVIVRLPDAAPATPRSSILTAQLSDGSTGRFVAYNTTCVHLRCLVNPGYGSNEYRLLCPCHGSQYRLADGVPVAGPAFELGLKPLPQIRLKIDSSTGLIQATEFNGTPGIGRDHDLS
jgi:Rieske Fe-S protein